MQSRKTGEQNIQNIHYAYDVWYGPLLLALSARCADLQLFFPHRVFAVSFAPRVFADFLRLTCSHKMARFVSVCVSRVNYAFKQISHCIDIRG